MRIGVVKELGGEGYQAGVRQRFDEAVALLTELGAEVVEVSCPHFPYALAAYYLILPSEASSNLAKFDGMRFGLRVRRGRRQPVGRAGHGPHPGRRLRRREVRRIMLGTYALSAGYYDAYYGSAQKVRTLIQRDFAAAFEQADVLVSPTAPTTAFKLGEKLDDPLAMYLNDIATIPANLAGTPGMSLPVGLAPEDGLPVGLQIMAPADGRRPALHGRRGARGGAARRAGAVRSSRRLRRCEHADRRGRRRPTTTSSPSFDPVLGLEVHVELGTATKMFCGCPTDFGAPPNTQVCPTCLGLPGSLPVVNAIAVESRDPHRPGAELPDRRVVPVRPEELLLPGHAEELPDLAVRRADRLRRLPRRRRRDRRGHRTFRVGIERAHMEEDTGKTSHQGGATGRIHGADYSLVDYNRAGIPLIEIVTKPIEGTGRYAPEVAQGLRLARCARSCAGSASPT